MKKPWEDHNFGISAEIVNCERCQKELDPRQNDNLCSSCFGIKCATDSVLVKLFMEHLFSKYHDEFDEYARIYFRLKNEKKEVV